MVYLHTKNPNLDIVWRAFEWEVLVYFMTFDIFYIYLVYLLVICCTYIPPFWYVVPRKIWQPCVLAQRSGICTTYMLKLKLTSTWVVCVALHREARYLPVKTNTGTCCFVSCISTKYWQWEDLSTNLTNAMYVKAHSVFCLNDPNRLPDFQGPEASF
jgi:hypothetical protein